MYDDADDSCCSDTSVSNSARIFQAECTRATNILFIRQRYQTMEAKYPEAGHCHIISSEYL